MNTHTHEKRPEPPLDAAEFARLFAPFSRDGERIALAVSGGPDSMALAWGVRACGLDAVALIVEHGLRPDSAVEAQEVSARLNKMGIEAAILRWEHGPLASRIHVEARKARFALLIAACKEQGIGVLLFAHHKGDQAETILMRFAKGSGLAGLAGMKKNALRDGVTLFRPLLGISKARLVATCEANNIPFVRDPSNEKEKYARGRLRRVHDALASEGFNEERLLDLAARADEAACAIQYYAEIFLKKNAQTACGGVLILSADALSGVPRAVLLQALSSCLMNVHRKEYPPERKALVRLADFLAGGQSGAMTLYGCIVHKGEKRILFLREHASIFEILPVAPGQTVFWDGRWNVRYDGKEKGVELRALGFQTKDTLDRLAPGLRKKVPWGRARAALPAFWRGKELIGIWNADVEKKRN